MFRYIFFVYNKFRKKKIVLDLVFFYENKKKYFLRHILEEKNKIKALLLLQKIIF